MCRHTHIALAAALALLYAFAIQQAAVAKVQLPSVFNSGMVIQRDQKVCVWGRAAPHEHVQVQIDSQTISTTANGNGDWQTTLPPLSVGEERTMIVQGTNRIVVSSIKVGDVYLCSGQSNMAFPLGASDFTEDDISQLDKLRLEIYTIPARKSKSGEPPDAHGEWKAMTPSTVQSFPAIPYLFGRSLSLLQKIPIGIICVPCNGATLESFLPPETVKRMHCENVPFISPGIVSSNFRTLIYPFLKVGLRGIVWYQGESNFLNTTQYRTVFSAFISDIRKRMNAPNLPFFYVQLPAFGCRQQEIVDSFWADMREAQAAALSLPDVHMVVTIDSATDDPPLHPKEKRKIALRLALLAKNKAEGKTIDKAPSLQNIEVKGDAMILSFDGIPTVLATSDGRAPRGFLLAGPDRKFYPAVAKFDHNKMEVTSDDVLDPQSVRYAWADNPDCNVCYGELPFPPFRTDKWPTNPKLNPEAKENVASR